jgi:hypothetical protein
MECVIKLDRSILDKNKKVVKKVKKIEIDAQYEPVVGFCVGKNKSHKGHAQWVILIPFCVIQITNRGIYNDLTL